MDIDSLKSVSLKPDDVLIVEVDVGMLPPSKATIHFQQIHEMLKESFPSNKIVIIPMHKVRLSVVNFADAPEPQITDVEFKEVQ